jgi:hypothetical protein
MHYLIKNEGNAAYTLTGKGDPCIGMYLKSYDPEAHDGGGEAIWTSNKDEAMHFENQMIAWQLWKVVPKARPTREDGKPNRPLTAFTITIEPA